MHSTATRITMATQQIFFFFLNLHSLPTMLIGSRSWGNGVAPEDSWGKKAAKVRARTAGRTGRGEPGVGLILAGRWDLSRNTWPAADSPPTWERETQGHRGSSSVGTSELTFTCNNYVSEQWQRQRLKVAAKFLLACTALCQCGDVIECPLNSWDERVQTHTHSYTHI